MAMNVYDFDKTISAKDSTACFVRYCALRYPRVLLTLPGTGVAAVGMALRIISKTQFKEYMYRFLRHVPDVDVAVKAFWDGGSCPIHNWYREAHRDDDIVISASPEFLLKPICERLGIRRLIASRVDPQTGKYTGLNCDCAEKARRFRQELPDVVPDKFYSDSVKDAPMAEISAQAALVRGERLLPWPGSEGANG